MCESLLGVAWPVINVLTRPGLAFECVYQSI